MPSNFDQGVAIANYSKDENKKMLIVYDARNSEFASGTIKGFSSVFGDNVIEGVVYITMLNSNKSDKYIEFRNKFFSKYKKEPELPNAYSYEAATFLFDSLEKVDEVNNQTINYLKYSVENFIIIPSRNLITIADLIKNIDDKESIDGNVDALATKDIDFSKVIILDENGTVEYVFSEENSSIVGFDYSLESTFVNIKNGYEEYWSDTYVDSESEKLALDYAVKLNEKVLVATILLEEFRKFADVIKYSNDILIDVTDKTGVYIFHTDYRNVEQRITDKYVNNRLLEFEKVMLDKKEYYGTIVSSDYLDWNVILYLPVDQIDLELNKFIVLLLLIIIVSVLLVLFLGNNITSRILKNLKKLISVTNKVALGNYEIENTSVNYRKFIEIMDNFKQMTNEIKNRENLIIMQKNDINALNEELEERVEDRTIELKKSNQMLESTILELNETQEQLVEREKLASRLQMIKQLCLQTHPTCIML
ncbi:MAG: hypothetical protein WBA54_12070 [Acidaminobacteraceae bacterium]